MYGAPDQSQAKRTLNNPFKLKAPSHKRTKLAPNQPTLNFLSTNKSSSSTVNLSLTSNPLKTASESDLNKSRLSYRESTKLLARSSSNLTFSSYEKVEQNDDDDLIELGSAPVKIGTIKSNPAQKPHIYNSNSHSLDSFSMNDSDADLFLERTLPSNLKNSQPIGSLISPSLPRSNTQPSTQRIQDQNKAVLEKVSNTQTSSSYRRNRSPWSNLKQVNAKKNPRLKDGKLAPIRSADNYESEFELSPEQSNVVKLVVEEKQSIFFTGSAGTGKSVILRELVEKLKQLHGVNAVGITASTGLAACNIGGITINKFSGMGIGEGRPEELFAKVKRNSSVREQWKRLKVLIIDEISMLDGVFFDKLEYVARNIRMSDRPFGGVQIVLTGDFFQLPPVPSKTGPSTRYCFESESWKSVIKKTILLKQVFRQKDPAFADILNNLRFANVTDEMEHQFKSLQRPVEYEDGIGPTELFPTRAEVENSNRRTLQALKGKEKTFIASDTGPPNLLYLLENTMAPKNLVLKEGASVMMLKNKTATLVNGSVGKIITFLSQTTFSIIRSKLIGADDKVMGEHLSIFGKCCGESTTPREVEDYTYKTTMERSEYLKLVEYLKRDDRETFPIVKFMNEGISEFVCVDNDDFSVGPDKDALVRHQVPLLLSWALSIHKSQGQTLDRVKVDLTKVFEAGQVYTALSRATSRDRLQVINFNRSKIHANSKVKEFYSKLESVIPE